MASIFGGESRLFPKQSQAQQGNGGGPSNYGAQRAGDIPAWEPGFQYDSGREVLGPDGNYYYATADHDSGSVFGVDVGAGLWTMFAGIGMGEDLATTLAIGNTTGANDIIVDAGQAIQYTDPNHRTYELGGNMVVENLVAGRAIRLLLSAAQFDATNDALHFTRTIDSVQWRFDAINGQAPSVRVTNVAGAQGITEYGLITANRTWTMPDRNGEFALTTDYTLQAVLLNGNTTSGTDIVVSAGDVIQDSSANHYFDVNDTANGMVRQIGDGGFVGFTETFTYGLAGIQTITWEQTTNGAGIGQPKVWFFLTDNQTAPADRNKVSVKSDFGSGASFESELILNGTHLSATRNWTLPDASGTIALTTDYTLANVLVNGNTTSGNDIVVSAGDELLVNTGAFIGFQAGDVKISGGATTVVILDTGGSAEEFEFDPNARTITSDSPAGNGVLDFTVTAARNWSLPDASGTLALTTDYTLTNVLANGNVTGANDIVVTNGQKILSSAGTATNRIMIEFVDGGFGPDLLNIKQNDVADGGAIQVASGGAYIGYWSGVGTVLTRLNITAANVFTFEPASGQPTLDLFDTANGNSGNLTIAPLATVSRTWTLPDKDGTLAVTSDFQTGQTYTTSNVTTDRVINANMTTMGEIADVLCTLINDLQGTTIPILL